MKKEDIVEARPTHIHVQRCVRCGDAARTEIGVLIFFNFGVDVRINLLTFSLSHLSCYCFVLVKIDGVSR